AVSGHGQRGGANSGAWSDGPSYSGQIGGHGRRGAVGASPRSAGSGHTILVVVVFGAAVVVVVLTGGGWLVQPAAATPTAIAATAQRTSLRDGRRFDAASVCFMSTPSHWVL